MVVGRRTLLRQQPSDPPAHSLRAHATTDKIVLNETAMGILYPLGAQMALRRGGNQFSHLLLRIVPLRLGFEAWLV